jgi:S1-C subfamily serine protease
MFAESNQHLLRASQQSANALKSEQKAFDRLWQRYKSWLNQTEADLEQARGIPLFAGTAGVPKLQKLSVANERLQGFGGNNLVQQRTTGQSNEASRRNSIQPSLTQLVQRGIVPDTELIVASMSATQISQVAMTITVLIDGQNPGSGVIVQRNGRTYYVLTAKHVVATPDEYDVVTPDKKKYRVDYKRVRKFNGVDLALLEFDSDENYSIARIGDSQKATLGAPVYVAGFPNPGREIRERIFQFRSGEISARPPKPLADGYALVYTNSTREGFSGGPVLDGNGLLIGIHGRAEVDANQPIPANQGGSVLPARVGVNLGVPINTFLELAKTVQLPVNFTVAKVTPPTTRNNPAPSEVKQPSPSPEPRVPSAPRTVEELVALANQSGRSGIDTLKLYNDFIATNPKNWAVYYHRGNFFYRADRYDEAFNDYTTVIKNLPNAVGSYAGRAALKWLRIRDYSGCIEDLNIAIKRKSDEPRLYQMRARCLRWSFSRENNNVELVRSALHDIRRAEELYRQQGNVLTAEVIKKDVEQFLNWVNKWGIPNDMFNHLDRSTNVWWGGEFQRNLPP